MSRARSYNVRFIAGTAGMSAQGGGRREHWKGTTSASFGMRVSGRFMQFAMSSGAPGFRYAAVAAPATLLTALEIATSRFAGKTIRTALPCDSGVIKHVDSIGMRQRKGHILFAEQHGNLRGLPQ
jgi:hypothetical protein